MRPLITLLVFSSLIVSLQAQSPLQKSLEGVYGQWRQTMIKKDYRGWQQVTARARQNETRNQVISQKKRFPSAVFALPMKPPSLAGLRPLQVKATGPTATAVYYGRADLKLKGGCT